MSLSKIMCMAWVCFTYSTFAQDKADRIDASELLSDRGEHSLIRKKIGPKLGGLTQYDFLVVTHSKVHDARAVAFKKIIKNESNDPFNGDVSRKTIAYLVVLVNSSGNKSKKKIPIDDARKLINEAWKLIESPTIGVQEKNLQSMKSLHDESYTYIFCRDPKKFQSGFYCGVLINPIKGSKSAVFLSKCHALMK